MVGMREEGNIGTLPMGKNNQKYFENYAQNKWKIETVPMSRRKI